MSSFVSDAYKSVWMTCMMGRSTCTPNNAMWSVVRQVLAQQAGSVVLPLVQHVGGPSFADGSTEALQSSTSGALHSRAALLGGLEHALQGPHLQWQILEGVGDVAQQSVAVLAVDLHVEGAGPLLHHHAHGSWHVAQQLHKRRGGIEAGIELLHTPAHYVQLKCAYGLYSALSKARLMPSSAWDCDRHARQYGLC